MMRSEYCQIIPGEIAKKIIDLAQDDFGVQSVSYSEVFSLQQMRQIKNAEIAVPTMTVTIDPSKPKAPPVMISEPDTEVFKTLS